MSNNIPNFDGMTPESLWSFYWRYSRCSWKDAETLLGGKPEGYTVIVERLAAYACNKAVAMKCRLDGDITAADIYEMICDDIYLRLPENCKW